MKRSATVAKLPPGYDILRPAAQADNGCLCRHVRVRKGATLREVKCAVLKGYEDQYAPDDIKLFTRKYEDDATVVRTDRTCATRLLSYGPDWHDCAVGDRGPADTVLLVASAMNEERRLARAASKGASGGMSTDAGLRNAKLLAQNPKFHAPRDARTSSG